MSKFGITPEQRLAEQKEFDATVPMPLLHRVAAELLFRMVWNAFAGYRPRIDGNREVDQKMLTRIARQEVEKWKLIPAIRVAIDSDPDAFDIRADVLDGEIVIDPSRAVQELAIGRSTVHIDWMQLAYPSEMQMWVSHQLNHETRRLYSTQN